MQLTGLVASVLLLALAALIAHAADAMVATYRAGFAMILVAVSLAVSAGQARAPASPFAFAVDVAYSATAARTLRARHEGVVASASFYGDPTRAGRAHANEVGQIDVGQEQVTMPGAASRFLIAGRTVRRGALRWVRGGKVEVNVNVFSARRSGPDNILDCTFFQDAIAVARARPVRLHCKLIGER